MPKVSAIQPLIPPKWVKTRVAAYARVSMDCEVLQHSLSAQISHYSSLIQGHPGWEYKGVFVDEGITGTSTRRRDGFKDLMAKCDAGEIDLVLVKSISRFARDTVDTLKTTRHLKELGIDVYFEREKIHSMSEEGELLLTLLASFAQEESRSISQNVTWRIRKKFEEGIPNGHKAPFGYEWDGMIFRIIPEQGKVVREIYDRYLAGETAYSIAKNLADRGIKGQTGVPMDDSTIKDIVTSISYTGTMILQKNFFTDGHVRKQNNGELPRYAVDEMFEPLVTEDELQKAMLIREKRAEKMPNKAPVLTAFSGIVKCENCGHSFSRRTSKQGKTWNCNTRERKGKAECDNRPVYETELMNAACTALGMDSFDEQTVKSKVEQITIGHESIEFRLKDGHCKTVKRKYQNGRGALSQKIKCGCCGDMLLRDDWRLGPKGEKVKTKVWTCRNCSLKRVLESEIEQAAVQVLKEKEYGAKFQQQIENIIVTADNFDFYFKGGKVITWQRK